MAKYTIRRTSNMEAVKELHVLCLPHDHWEDPTAAWLVFREGRTVGFATILKLVMEPDCGFLQRSGIVKEERGNGLQRRLLAVRERWARRARLEWLLTYVVPENGASLKNLLLAGYRTYAPQYAWVGREVVYLRKRL